MNKLTKKILICLIALVLLITSASLVAFSDVFSKRKQPPVEPQGSKPNPEDKPEAG